MWLSLCSLEVLVLPVLEVAGIWRWGHCVPQKLHLPQVLLCMGGCELAGLQVLSWSGGVPQCEQDCCYLVC